VGRDGLPVIEKATRILELFIDSGAGSLPFGEIKRGAGMSPATTHRVLGDLVEYGFLVQQGQRNEYRIGPLLVALGVLSMHHSTLASVAPPYMERLRDECGETVIVAELHGDAVVPVLRADGLYEMRMNQQVGARYPAYAGGTGKVLLAHLAEDDLDEYLSAVELVPLTDRTVTDASALRQELTRIRNVGVAISRGERVPEAVAISAPLFNVTGAAVAALTISGVASRFDEQGLIRHAQVVKARAAEISRALGFRDERAPADGKPRGIDVLESEEYASLRAMCRRAVSRQRTSRRAAV
jgi:DNA-binding IclR family transcriptional regulator